MCWGAVAVGQDVRLGVWGWLTAEMRRLSRLFLHCACPEINYFRLENVDEHGIQCIDPHSDSFPHSIPYAHDYLTSSLPAE